MQNIPPDDILYLGLSLLKNFGEYMHYTSKKLYIFRVINISVLAVTLFFIAANLTHADGATFIKTIEGASTVIHILVKYLMFLYYKPHIENLLDDHVRFWDYRKFDDKGFRNIQMVFRYVKVAQNYMVIAITCAMTLHWLRPYFNENNVYVYECWIFWDSTVLETAVLVCQYYFLTAAIPVVLGYDCIYFSYSIHVVIQLGLLKDKLKYMPIQANIGELYKCIKQHRFLLSGFGRIQFIYFWMLLFHYFLTLATCCTQLYVLLLGKLDSGDILAAIIYSSNLFVEFAYFTFPVGRIVSDLRDISNSIYMSSWYERDLAIQKVLLFMMIKAQNQKYLLAGGMIEMNEQAFGSVVRKSFSFYAVVRNILNQ